MGNIRNMRVLEQLEKGLEERRLERLDRQEKRVNERVLKQLRREELERIPKEYVDGAEKWPPRGFKKGLVAQVVVAREAAKEGEPPNIKIQVEVDYQRLTRFIPFNPDNPDLERRTLQDQMFGKYILYSISKRSGKKVGTFLLPGEKLTGELRADLEVNKQPVYPPVPPPLNARAR